jgi:Fe-S-cluster-containing hydrogenase component 2
VCPTDAIDPPAVMNYNACIGCGLCIPACPEDAIAPEGRGHKYLRVVREMTGM